MISNSFQGLTFQGNFPIKNLGLRGRRQWLHQKWHAQLGVCIYFSGKKSHSYHLSFRVIHDPEHNEILWRFMIDLNTQNIYITFLSAYVSTYFIKYKLWFLSPPEIKHRVKIPSIESAMQKHPPLGWRVDK